MRRTGVAFIAVLLVVATIESAAAQTTPADQARLRLLMQPLWHEAGDRLDLKLSVDNPGTTELDGFIVTIAEHERSSSRSALHEAIDGNAGFTASSFS
ncbi:MAG TPA: hypothetical protein VNP73_10995, partial [Actinomycetota bacterium]|nr:hypothetical protein [Actinomycetota bacterium]